MDVSWVVACLAEVAYAMNHEPQHPAARNAASQPKLGDPAHDGADAPRQQRNAAGVGPSTKGSPEKERPQKVTQRVQLECYYGIRAPKTIYGMALGPNSMMALQLDPLGKSRIVLSVRYSV